MSASLDRIYLCVNGCAVKFFVGDNVGNASSVTLLIRDSVVLASRFAGAESSCRIVLAEKVTETK